MYNKKAGKRWLFYYTAKYIIYANATSDTNRNKPVSFFVNLNFKMKQ